MIKVHHIALSYLIVEVSGELSNLHPNTNFGLITPT